MTYAEKFAPILHFHPKEGTQCCFSSSAEDAYPRARNGITGEHREPNVLNPSAPCYVEEHLTGGSGRIKYWFWYNYNDFATGPDFWGSHPGDWESFEVVLNDGMPIAYFYSNHESVRFVDARKFNRRWRTTPRSVSRRDVWVANGSHANYESPNVRPYCTWGACDELADGGPVWDTQPSLVDVTGTSFWKDGYIGDWGDGADIKGPPARLITEYTMVELRLRVDAVYNFIEFKIQSDQQPQQTTKPWLLPGSETFRWSVGKLGPQNIWYWWDNFEGHAHIQILVNGNLLFAGECKSTIKDEQNVLTTCRSPDRNIDSWTKGSPWLDYSSNNNDTFIRK